MKINASIRALSALLALFMLVSTLPLNIWAEDLASGDENSEAGSNSVILSNPADDTELPDDGITERPLEYVGWGDSMDPQKPKTITRVKNIGGVDQEVEVYQITNPHELTWLALEVNAGNCKGVWVELCANIDYGGKNWTPIGTEASPFEGNFDGGFHEVKNYNISHPVDNETGAITIDTEDQYVGFFGYVKDSSISNFGVWDYTIDYAYSFNTTIGGLVAYSVGSSFTNCYAYGDIGARFCGTSDLWRLDEMISYTTVPDEINVSNEYGQLAVIDLTSLESDTISKTLTIGGDLTGLIVKGNFDKTYKGFNIKIATTRNADFYLEFENLKLTDSSITVEKDAIGTLFICSSGKENSITAANDKGAIQASSADVYFIGSAKMTVRGGNGSPGSAGKYQELEPSGGSLPKRTVIDGGKGLNGQPAVQCKTATVNMDGGILYLYGGNGGYGGEGGSVYGAGNYDGTPTLPSGGHGGNGGNGGVAIDTENDSNDDIVILAMGSFYAQPGNGGRGGDGGQGGNVYETEKWQPDQGGAGGNGGRGGNGFVAGNGGHGGKGGYSYGRWHWFEHQYGVCGAGGNGGDTGIPLAAFDGENYYLSDSVATAGTKGGCGNIDGDYESSGKTCGKCDGDRESGKHCGYSGYNGRVLSATVTDAVQTGFIEGAYSIAYDDSNPPRMYSVRSTLTIGGFAGYIDLKTKVDKCSAIVNDVYSNTDGKIQIVRDYHTAVCGNFVGEYQYDVSTASFPSVSSVIAAYYNADGELCKYETKDENGNISYPSWFGRGEGPGCALEGVSVLKGNTDDRGIKYYTMLDGDELVGVVSGYDASKLSGDIRVPDVIFGGRFVVAVKKIDTWAFKGSTEITSVDIGNSVDEIGYEIFKGCSNLKTITIGASLTSIPDRGLGFIFGLEKYEQTIDNNNKYSWTDIIEDGYALEKYVVSPDNTVFASDDNGILYRKLKVPFDSGEENALVAIIDVPALANLKSYQVPAHIVRIEDNAFAYNTSLTKISVAGVRDIGSNAFLACEGLEEVSFKNPNSDNYKDVVEIFDNTVDIPEIDYKQSIGARAFALCTALDKVDLECEYITKIGDGAFADCGDGLEEIAIGKGVESIGDKAFTSLSGSASLTKVKKYSVHSKNQYYCSIDDVLYKINGDTYSLLLYPVLKEANTFILPEKVTRIEENAFRYSANLHYVYLTSDSLEYIGQYAFANTNIFTVDLGSNVSSLGENIKAAGTVFNECPSLAEINVSAENQYFTNNGDDGVLYSKDMTILCKYPADKRGEEFYIPDSVETVSSYAFWHSIYLHRVVFASSVNRVALGEGVFLDCNNLLSIYFKNTDAPDVSTALGQVFETGNDRTYIFYTTQGYNEYSENWDKFIENNTNLNIAESNIIPSLDDYKDDEYYAIVVVNKLGLPINGVHVELKLNEDNTVCDSDIAVEGIRIFTDNSADNGFVLDYSKSYTLTVVDSQGDYFPFENSEFYLDEDTRINYVTLSSVPTVSGTRVSYSVNSVDKIKEVLTEEAVRKVTGGGYKVCDINSQTAKINKWCVENILINLTCGMDPNVTITGVRIVQGNEIKYLNTDTSSLPVVYSTDKYGKKQGKIAVNVNTASLENEVDLYAIVDFSEGSSVQEKLNIHVFEFAFTNIDLSALSGGLKLQVAEQLQSIIKGLSVELEVMPQIFPKMEVETGSDDSYKVKISGEVLPNGVADISIFGSVELKYVGLDENLEPEIDVIGNLGGSIKITHEFPPFRAVIVFIPVQVKCELSVEGKLMLELVYDDTYDEILPAEVDIELKGVLQLDGGIGGSFCGVGASFGAYAKAEVMFLIKLIPEAELKKWTLKGDVGLYAEAKVGKYLKLRGELSLFEGLGIPNEWVIYENGYWWYERGSVQSASTMTYAAVYDESSYVLAKSVSEYSGDEGFSFKGIESSDEVRYDALDPEAIRVGDKIYYFYHEDLNGFSDSYNEDNFQKIVYQYYDITNATYSEVCVLEDNGLIDDEFSLYYDGTDFAVVYTQLEEKIESQTEGDITESVREYLKLTEVKVAVLNENGGFDIHTITENDVYDMHVKLTKVNGKLAVVWVENPENSMFGITENNNLSIKYSVYDGEKWSEAKVLKSGINTIADIEVCSDYVVYVTDTNNDFRTIGTQDEDGYSDKIINIVYFDETKEMRQSAEGAYPDVSFIDGKLVYYFGNNFYTVDPENSFSTGAAMLDTAVEGISEEYRVLVDSQGNTKAILYVDNVDYLREATVGSNGNWWINGIDTGYAEGECTPEIGENSNWWINGIDTGIASSVMGSNIFAIFCDGDEWGDPLQLTDYGENYFVSSYDAVDFGDEIMISASVTRIEYVENEADGEGDYLTYDHVETAFYSYPDSYEMTEITVDYDSIIPNSDTTITVKIKNNSYLTLTQVPVSGSAFSGTISLFYDEEGNLIEGGLLPGKTGYIKITFNVGEADASKVYTVVINGKSESLRLWYSDYAVYGKQVLIGDTYHIVARVTNKGYVSGSYTLSAMLGDDVFATYENISLVHGESKYFTIPLETYETSDLVILRINADSEITTDNNEAKLNISTNAVETVEAESLSVYISTTKATADKSDPVDMQVTFDGAYDLVSISIGDVVADSSYYSVSGETVTLHVSKFINNYENGSDVEVLFKFTDNSTDENGNLIYKYATLKLTVTQTFSVTWKDDDGVEIGTDTYTAGSELVVPADPVKEATETYYYTFFGWDIDGDGVADDLSGLVVESDITAIALFERSDNTFEVTWVVEGESYTEIYISGTTPEYEGTPRKPSTAMYQYTFAGWDEKVSENGNITYTAQFTESLRQYTITFVIGNETISEQYEYGTVLDIADPVIEPDAQYYYTFIGWDKEFTPVWNDKTYTAELELTLRQYTVTWVVEDEVTEETYFYGDLPAYYNEEYSSDIPTKASTEQYEYSFAGWDHNVETVTGDVTYTAVFDEWVKTYIVEWIVGDFVDYYYYEYGMIPEYPYEITGSDDRYEYVFKGWDKELVPVTEDTTYTAILELIPIYYTVTWCIAGEFEPCNHDNCIVENYQSGDMPEYKGETPTKATDEAYSYRFTGWTPNIDTVGISDVTYYAQYETTSMGYTVTWLVCGEVWYEEQYAYGEMPMEPGMPTKESDEQYHYEFLSWEPSIEQVTGDVTYNAVFIETPREYRIVWVIPELGGSGERQEYESTYYYGELPSHIVSGITTDIPESEQYTYTFIGWSPEVQEVTGDAVYEAVYEITAKTYTVTWIIGDTCIDEEYAYGEYPEYKGELYKAPDENGSYRFVYWNPEIQTVDRPIVYEAVFELVESESIEPTVNNVGADKSGAVITAGEGGWITGINTFTVECDKVCFVLVSNDNGQTYTRLSASATDTDGVYSFTAELNAETIISVVVAGDANGDGQITVADVAKVGAYNLGKTTMNSLQQVACDVNHDGKISIADVAKLGAFNLGKTAVNW